MIVAKGDVIACRPLRPSGHLIRGAQKLLFQIRGFQSYANYGVRNLQPFFHSVGLSPPRYCYDAVHVGIVTEAHYQGDPNKFRYIDIQPNNGVTERTVDLTQVAIQSNFLVVRPRLPSDVLDIVCQVAKDMQTANYQYFTDHVRLYARTEALEFVKAVFQYLTSSPNQQTRDALYDGAESALFCTCLVVRAFSEAAGAVGRLDCDPFDNTQSAFYWPHKWPFLLPCQVVGNGFFDKVIT